MICEYLPLIQCLYKKTAPIGGGFFATITYAAIQLSEHDYSTRPGFGSVII